MTANAISFGSDWLTDGAKLSANFSHDHEIGMA
jgi:hypothetical protein